MKKPKKKIKKIRDLIPVYHEDGTVRGHLDPNNDYWVYTQVPGAPPERERPAAMRWLSHIPPGESSSWAVVQLMRERGLGYTEAQQAISAARIEMRAQLEDRPVLVEILKSMNGAQIADLGDQCKVLMSEKGLSEREARKRLLLGARQ